MSATILARRPTRRFPLHSIGCEIKPAAEGIPATWGDAMKQASLDWQVKAAPLYPIGCDGSQYAAKSAPHGIFKIDDKGDLTFPPVSGCASVSSRYTPIQNRDVGSLLDELTGDGLLWERAGAFNNGANVWALGRLGADFEPLSGDVFRPYILALTSHDGSGSLRVATLLERVACSNAIHAALTNAKKADRYVSIRHTINALSESRIKEARAVLKLHSERIEQTAAAMADLAKLFLPAVEVQKAIAHVAAEETKANGAIRHLLATSDTIPDEMRATGYGVIQALTEYASHYAPARTQEGRASHIAAADGLISKINATSEILAGMAREAKSERMIVSSNKATQARRVVSV